MEFVYDNKTFDFHSNGGNFDKYYEKFVKTIEFLKNIADIKYNCDKKCYTINDYSISITDINDDGDFYIANKNVYIFESECNDYKKIIDFINKL